MVPRTFQYKFGNITEINFVYRIKCPAAKEAGKQYTLTILPHFLLPGCLVRADDVFAAGMDKELRKDVDDVCEQLKVLDERTSWKHLSRFDECLSDFNISLARIISELGTYLPYKKPEVNHSFETNIEWFKILAEKVITLRERSFGFENLSLFTISGIYGFFMNSAYPCATYPGTTRINFFKIWPNSPPDHV